MQVGSSPQRVGRTASIRGDEIALRVTRADARGRRRNRSFAKFPSHSIPGLDAALREGDDAIGCQNCVSLIFVRGEQPTRGPRRQYDEPVFFSGPPSPPSRFGATFRSSCFPFQPQQELSFSKRLVNMTDTKIMQTSVTGASGNHPFYASRFVLTLSHQTQVLT